MKIVSQSNDQMVLQEGNTSGIVVGIAMAIAGILVAWFLHASKPMTL